MPQRPAVMAGNELMAVQSLDLERPYPRLTTSEIVTTDIVPSTSNTHQRHLRHRDPQVNKLHFTGRPLHRNCSILNFDFKFRNVPHSIY